MLFKKKDKKDKKDSKQKNTVAQADQSQTASIEQFNNTVDNSFFYTNDKKLNAIDDGDVIEMIASKYPQFNQQTKDSVLKKTLLEVLQNNDFMEALLKHFDLNVHDFIAIVYKQYSSLFNALFIKKVKDALKHCKYAKDRKRHY